jgi:hypothetical protein
MRPPPKRQLVGEAMRSFRLFIFVVLASLLAAAPALADDWTVIKLRGDVQQLIDGNWTVLNRGDIVPDDRSIRTQIDGHADLQRGQEVVTLGASTQIQIHDKADVRYTTVQQDSGTVEVEAQVENVKHFEVDTKFLAAVVKGTHFIVTATDTGASVAVSRGMVAVESMASKRNTTVTVGQTVVVASANDMVVGGTGPLPAVFAPDGSVFEAASLASAPVPDLSGSTALASAPAAQNQPDAPMVTAVLVNPADVAAVTGPQLRGSFGAAGLGTALRQAVMAPQPKEEPSNLLTIGIGLLIGIVIGAVALALRRAVG